MKFSRHLNFAFFFQHLEIKMSRKKKRVAKLCGRENEVKLLKLNYVQLRLFLSSPILL